MKKKIVKPKKIYIRGIDKSEAEKVLKNKIVKPKAGRPKKNPNMKGIDKEILKDISYKAPKNKSKKDAEESWDSPYPDVKCFHTGPKKIPKKTIKKTKKKVGERGECKPKTTPTIKKISKQKKIVDDIFSEIYNHVAASKDLKVLYENIDFDLMLIVKSVELKVSRVNNQSVFQPYESNNINNYCLLNIIKGGEGDVTLGIPIIDALLDIGCPAYRINHIEDVARVLNEIGG